MTVNEAALIKTISTVLVSQLTITNTKGLGALSELHENVFRNENFPNSQGSVVTESHLRLKAANLHFSFSFPLQDVGKVVEVAELKNIF